MMAYPTNQVLIGFSSRLFSNGLESIIDGFDDFNVLNSVPIGNKLTKILVKNDSPEIMILEVDHPKDRDLNYIQSLHDSCKSVRILLLSHVANSLLTRNLLDSGILGYLLKSCTSLDLHTALKKMSENKPYFCSDITKTLVKDKRSDHHPENNKLTYREIQILTLLVQSHTNRHIANQLDISENTVKTHRRNIQKKFGVSNLLGMVRYACRENLIDFGCAEFCTTCPYVY